MPDKTVDARIGGLEAEHDTTPAAQNSEPEITQPHRWMRATATSAPELPTVPDSVKAGCAQVFADLVACHEQLRRSIGAAQELDVDISQVLKEFYEQHPVPVDVDDAVNIAVWASTGLTAIFDVTLSISALADSYHGCAGPHEPLADPAVLWPAAAHPLPDPSQSAA